MKSEELFKRATQVAPGGVHSPVRSFKGVGGDPLFFSRAEGARVTSVEGKSYIDFCQSFGPLILGHRDPDVTEKVQEILGKVWTLGACEPYSLELAEYITSRIPWMDQLRFVSSGTEAVMSALRVARAATGRTKILKFEGCYHGHADALLVKAGSGLAGESASDSAGVSQEVIKETLVCGLDDEESFTSIMDKWGHEIAVVLIEPLPANYGLLIQRPEFLKKVADLTRAKGALLLFDEVISGFRVAFGGMAEVTGVVPDLVTYGKILGGGFPVGAYGARRELMEWVAPAGPVYQAGTLSAHPVGMVAGLATLKKIEKEDVYKILNDRAESFYGSLQREIEKLDASWKLSHYGSLFWWHRGIQATPRSLKDLAPGHAEAFKKFFQLTLKRGLYLAPSGYEVGFLSWAHTPDVLEEAAHFLVEALAEYEAG